MATKQSSGRKAPDDSWIALLRFARNDGVRALQAAQIGHTGRVVKLMLTPNAFLAVG
jgi:hypothetical protein